jgi:type I restriction enzyme R subunit
MNQNPEQIARDAIDRQLTACGWVIQDKKDLNLNASPGIAIREYHTDSGSADYALFVDGKPAGVIEAKRQEEGERLTVHEDQAERYAKARLQYHIYISNILGLET